MSSLEDYQYLWDGSSPTWCLLETKPWNQEENRFIIFNSQNPIESPAINWRYKLAVQSKMIEAGIRIISLDEQLEDPVREYCRQEGRDEEMIRRTFDYLIERWEIFVKKVLSGTYRGRDDYLYDLGFRSYLEQLIEFAGDMTPSSIKKQMYQLDSELKTILQPSSVGSIWGAEFTNELYSREKHWYYFMLPTYTAEVWEREVRAIREGRVRLSREGL
ncbi:hypothetical protein [Trichocoleus sp. FACHB-262]|uniref:hypothetical protein n=1 Tax=Trichocoleus sp. FACHB-262 TaxID=2692869 RepID=UPI001686CCEC|nr:hypothetical protein [Trichocoleus sp. FACHB-262]MBD2122460.1 hypothetical protein [Trichocoleus sp. FACHB-262]